jgi:hypothetical protein
MCVSALYHHAGLKHRRARTAPVVVGAPQWNPGLRLRVQLRSAAAADMPHVGSVGIR